MKGEAMAEVLSVELIKPTSSGIARFAKGQPPIGTDGHPIMATSEGGEEIGTLLPTVKAIKFFKYEIDSGRVWTGPCYLITLEEDLKMVVNAANVAVTLYQNEKKQQSLA
jgi:hypothetical protein